MPDQRCWDCLLYTSENLRFTDVTFKGKYSFQYIENAVFENCRLDTKDAFWHAKDVTVRDSVVKGEYLGWYSEGLTLIRCKIIGTQPLCYCKKLKLVDCQMEEADLCFEKSQVEATVTKMCIRDRTGPGWGPLSLGRRASGCC